VTRCGSLGPTRGAVGKLGWLRAGPVWVGFVFFFFSFNLIAFCTFSKTAPNFVKIICKNL
jgi:hypothetical protein